MRTVLTIISICLLPLTNFGQCGKKGAEVYKMLGSYVYDNSAEVRIGTFPRGQLQTFHFKVYKSPTYRFAFDRTACDEDVHVKLFEINKKSGAKELVYESVSNEEIQKDIYEPQREYVVEVLIPENSDKGCMSIILGFKMKAEGTGKKKGPRVKFK